MKPAAPTLSSTPSTSGRQRLRQMPARILLGTIRLYQRFLSPVLPVVTLGACSCRFSPTCSHYAAEAVRTHGALLGAWLALRRLLKCTPLHPGGFDPVPAHVPAPFLFSATRAKPVCRSATWSDKAHSLS